MVVLLDINMTKRTTDLDTKNIQGLLVDTRDMNQYAGDYEWIGATKNSYIISGTSISSGWKKDDITNIYTSMGNSHLSKVREFLTEITDEDVVGFAHNRSEIIKLINEHQKK